MEKRNESNMLIKNDLQTEITRLKKVVQDQKNEIGKLKREIQPGFLSAREYSQGIKKLCR